MKRDQIFALIRAHVDGDEERFRALVLQMRAHEQSLGHNAVAGALNDLCLRIEKKRSRPAASALTREQAAILVESRPTAGIDGLVLPPEQLRVLSRFVEEHRKVDQLAAYGLSPSRKILLAGPPGTGKTLTASALAGELDLPLFRVPLDAVITGTMGATAAKLRLVFNAVRDVPGVYLLDEFDALGSSRENGKGGGDVSQESRNILNSLLVFLDEVALSRSVVVAATNLATLLDKALFRRFDVHLEYDLPDVELIRSLITRSVPHEIPVEELEDVVNQALGLSGSDVVSACLEARKSAVLAGAPERVVEHLLESIKVGRGKSPRSF